MSVIRDTPLAAMGLLDFSGKAKWSDKAWTWHRETICLLATDQDRRSFTAGEPFRANMLVSHYGPRPLRNGRIIVNVSGPDKKRRFNLPMPELSPGALSHPVPVEFVVPAELRDPERFDVEMRLDAPGTKARNEWSFWALPAPAFPANVQIWKHASLRPSIAAQLPGARAFDAGAQDGIVVASRFDDHVVQFLERGGKALVLPDGQSNSFPLVKHWFLRGAPYISECMPRFGVGREFWIDLQAFDLAAEVIPNIGYLEEIDPWLMLWDTHGQAAVKDHGLLFATRAGRGDLVVSALRHDPSNNSAGPWLLGRILDQLANGPAARRALTAESWTELKAKLHEDSLPLTQRTWRFQPDPKNQGLSEGWSKPDHADAAWPEIRVGTAWEAQGHPALDGWAWYRITVTVPAHWSNRPVFLNIEGADDHYELYVNGELVGSAGDINARKTAFEQRNSHDITARAVPGQPLLITFRVYDWFGAGGLFRPITLRTTPFRKGGEILR
jgi:hypothetical protein